MIGSIQHFLGGLNKFLGPKGGLAREGILIERVAKMRIYGIWQNGKATTYRDSPKINQ